jgi:excisionase family DNA binding protein
MSMSEFKTIKEVSQVLRCSTDQVRILIDSGELNAICTSSGKLRRTYVIPQEAFDDFLLRRATSRPVANRSTPSRRTRHNV